MTDDHQVCSRCIYDSTIPNIEFDDAGVCSYCHQIDDMAERYPNDERGKRHLDELVAQMKKDGKRRKYDAVIGVSGGCDSSYLMHLMSQHYGLRLLAVHFDNTWNSRTATENIHRVTTKLGIDLFTEVVNATEFDDVYLSFLKAGVRDIDCPTDIALAATMGLAAAKFKVKYRIDGHSFRTEGSAPMGLVYMDARYIKSVHKAYGTRSAKSLPKLWLHRQLRWMLLNRVKSVRPLYHLEYDKEAAKKLLTEEYDWTWYGGHHLENRTASFFHSYFAPRRWNSDFRVIGYAAHIRDGRMTREEGLRLMSEPPFLEEGLLDYFKKRLSLSDSEFERLMTLPKAYYVDFPTYKKTFERMRPFFYLMAKADLVPWSFYMKYTVPHEVVRD